MRYKNTYIRVFILGLCLIGALSSIHYSTSLFTIAAAQTVEVEEGIENPKAEEDVNENIESTPEKESGKLDTVTKDGLTMTAKVGIDRKYKYGKKVRVAITITNEQQDFIGAVQIFGLSNNQVVKYERDINIALNETKTYDFYISSEMFDGGLSARLVTEDATILLSKKVRSSTNYLGDKNVIGIFTDNQLEMNYVTTNDNETMFLEPSDVTESYESILMLDTLIINEFNVEKLDSSQYMAISEWVKQGGSLIIGTGTLGTSILDKFKDLLEVESIGNITTIETNYGLIPTTDEETTDKSYQNLLRSKLQETKEAIQEQLTIQNIDDDISGYILTIGGMKSLVEKYSLEDQISIPTKESILSEIADSGFQKYELDLLPIRLKDTLAIYKEGSYDVVQQVSKGAGTILVYGTSLSLEAKTYAAQGAYSYINNLYTSKMNIDNT